MIWGSKFVAKGKTAVIIGASQGLGAELALQLYSQQCCVILVARTESKLIAQCDLIAKAQSHDDNNVSVLYIVSDVSKYEELQQLWKTICERGHDPDYIFCCAGLLIPKLFEDLTPHDLSGGITTNYATALNVIHTGHKLMLAQHPNGPYKHRHIILFLLVVSFFPFIGYAQYAPLKAAIQSLSLVLRQELLPYNYRVSCVFPGNFQSDGYDEEQLTKPEITKLIEGALHAIPASQCAEIVLDQLNKGYDTITTDTVGWLLGCSVLGTLPRSWLVLQIIVSFVFLLIAPIAQWVVERDISNDFKKRAKSIKKDE